MILTDTGPIVALLDADDGNHSACVAIAKRLPADPMLTTWPCFTEAMYLLGAVGEYFFQEKLWQLWSAHRLILYDLTDVEITRMSELMIQYQDIPMDLADASLVAIAESLSINRIFTLDSHFYVYRLSDDTAFDIIG